MERGVAPRESYLTDETTCIFSHLPPLHLWRGGRGVRSQAGGVSSPASPAARMSRWRSESERASFADNSVKYEATLRFINSSVRTMLEAIKGQA